MSQSSDHVAGYDAALAEALADDSEAAELRERLLAGEANDDDRRTGRQRLDDVELRRFELAHPSPPRERAREVDGGELSIARDELDGKQGAKRLGEELSERLRETVEDGPPGELVMRVSVRIPAPD